MTMFNEREQAFEAKYVHDAEQRFHEIGRRNQLLGVWAAEQLGLTGPEAADYIASIVHAEVLNADDRVVIAKVAGHMAAAGRSLSQAQLIEKMEKCLDEARAQLQAARPPI